LQRANPDFGAEKAWAPGDFRVRIVPRSLLGPVFVTIANPASNSGREQVMMAALHSMEPICET